MLPTIFHVTHWKAGSQWVRGILEHAVPHRIVHPTRDQHHLFGDPLVPGGVYTPVYAAEPQLRPILRQNPRSRAFVVVRDPRDTLISWYYSFRYSHGDEWETVPEVRQMLSSLNMEDGLALLIRRELCDVINIQMTWLQAGAKIFRYEDLVENEFAGFRALFDYCEIEFPDSQLRQLLSAHSFERQSGRKRGDENARAFHRKAQPGDWRNHFTPRLQTFYRTYFGDATVRMGYAPPGPARW